MYFDDSNVYIDATPHTLSSSGYVTFNLISKIFTGDIDAAIGFSVSDVKPKMPELWRNYSHTLFRWIDVNQTRPFTFYNVSGYWEQTWNETVTPDIGNRFNQFLYLVNGTDWEGDYSYLVAFQTFQFVGDNIDITYTFTAREKETYESWFYDWQRISLDVSQIQYNYQGIDNWYFVAQDVPVVANINYTFRMWVEIPFSGLESSSGEYYVAFKPSFQTIAQAIAAGNFYYLDPWWDTDWTYAKKLTFDNSGQGENLDDFPVLVNLTSSNFNFSRAESDGSDLRFLDSDNSTELAYEREYYNSTADLASIWVRVPRINGSSSTDHIFMYYGNSGASDGENITGVWSASYMAVYHLSETSGAYNDSTTNDNDGTVSGSPTRGVTGQIHYAVDINEVDDERVDLGNDTSLTGLTGNFTILVWLSPDDMGQNSNGRIVDGGDYDGSPSGWYLGTVGTNQVSFYRYIDGNIQGFSSSTNALTLGTMQQVVGRRFANFTAFTYVNNTQVGSGTLDSISAADTQFRIGIRSADLNRELDADVDEVRFMNVTRSVDWIDAQYLSMTDTFITFGSEEEQAGGGASTYSRTATITITKSLTQQRSFAGSRTSTNTDTLNLVASRVGTFNRDTQITAILDLVASRQFSGTRSASITDTLSLTASRVKGFTRSAAITATLNLVASRSQSLTRSAAITIIENLVASHDQSVAEGAGGGSTFKPEQREPYQLITGISAYAAEQPAAITGGSLAIIFIIFGLLLIDQRNKKRRPSKIWSGQKPPTRMNVKWPIKKIKKPKWPRSKWPRNSG